METLSRGELVEYGGDDGKTVTNKVVFQFNPETMTRTIRIPSRPAAATHSRETRNSGEVPYESISLTIHFSAADQLNVEDSQAINFGVSHQLAALEQMSRPPEKSSGQDSQSVDPVADAASAGNSGPAVQPTPRQQFPNVLFTWGQKKLLPVIIDSLSITEKQFDARLNPIQAEATLGLSVVPINPFTEDPVARGAANYSNLAKDEQSASNRARGTNTPNTGFQQIEDVIQI
jgi:hypothetical protein